MVDATEQRCPLCDGPLFGWQSLPPRDPAEGEVEGAPGRVFDRCESCGVGVERGGAADLEAELAAISAPAGDGALRIDCPSRASLQAFLGGSGWEPLDRLPGRLAHTPASISLLAERTGHRLDGISFPPAGRNVISMWQTIINAFTFRDNFARDAWRRELRVSGARGRAAAAIDALVTVLATPLVGLISLPMEAIAALLDRGGRMVAVIESGGADATPPALR